MLCLPHCRSRARLLLFCSIALTISCLLLFSSYGRMGDSSAQITLDQARRDDNSPQITLDQELEPDSAPKAPQFEIIPGDTEASLLMRWRSRPLVVGWNVPVADWGVSLPRGGGPSPYLASSCRVEVAQKVHCQGIYTERFEKTWNVYTGLNSGMRAFAIDDVCDRMYISAGGAYMGTGLCPTIRDAVAKCGAGCKLLHAEPVGCLRPFNWESNIKPIEKSGTACAVEVFSGSRAQGTSQRLGTGTWPLSFTVGSLKVHGDAGCTARLFEMDNAEGWSGTFGRGIHLDQDVNSRAPGGGKSLQVGSVAPDIKKLCRGSRNTVPRQRRFAIMADPCGMTHGGQGLGGMMTTYQIGVQIAHGLSARFLHNPAMLCADRDNTGYVAERLFQFDYCELAEVKERVKRGELSVVTLQLLTPGHGIHDAEGRGSDDGWQELIRDPFQSKLLLAGLKKANLNALPQEVLLEIRGCPWVRSWASESPGVLMQKTAGKFLRNALTRGWKSQRRKSQWRHPAVRIAVHFRYGDVGKNCPGVWGVDNSCGSNSELNDKYHSDEVSIIMLLQAIVPILNATIREEHLDVHMVLFSEGSPDDKPFQAFRTAFPSIDLQLSNPGSSQSDATLTADIFQMASADIMVSSCGTFTNLLSVLNDCGVVLAPGCSFGELQKAPCKLPIYFNRNNFDRWAFSKVWHEVYQSRVLARQHSVR